MGLLGYIGFIYMVVHLSLFFFKKGIDFRDRLEKEILPTQKQRIFINLKILLKRISYFFKSILSKEAKLVRKETKKPYNTNFDQFLINLLKEKRNTKEIYDIIRFIFLLKEIKCYKSFPFILDCGFSKEIQFYEMRKEISYFRNKILSQIIKEKNDNGTMDPLEYKAWREKLTKMGFVIQTPKQEVDSQNKMNGLSNLSNENSDIKVNVSENDVTFEKDMSVREVSKKRVTRF